MAVPDNEDGATGSPPTEPKLPGNEHTEAEAKLDKDLNNPIYDKLAPSRKVVIVALLSYCCFLSPTSSTSILAALPEATAEFQTSSSMLGLSNAMYLLFMGIGPSIWGPLGQVYGRRWICTVNAALFTCWSLGTALSPNVAAYFVFRMLTALSGTSFLTLGSAIIGDIYRPTERATAMGWFLSGITIGPALGPFIGGVIVTFASWRGIFWLQTALAGVAAAGTLFLLPETIHHARSAELAGLPLGDRLNTLGRMCNPWRVIKLFRYPNLVVASLALSSVIWNMYSLLTPIRYVLNPRFNLTTPIQSGLFYLAPGFGFLVGTFLGGRYADYIVKKWIRKRGERVPEDRVRSAILCQLLVIPGCMLGYGWSIEKAAGGIPVAVCMMFIQGVAQSFCFASVNTFCLDVRPDQGAEVIAGSFMTRFFFAALGTAIVIPAIEAIGVGWFSTISAGFVFTGGLLLTATVRWGKGWREAIDRKKKASLGVEKAEQSLQVQAVTNGGISKIERE